MDADAIYVMDNRQYPYDELCDAIEAEAATSRRRPGGGTGSSTSTTTSSRRCRSASSSRWTLTMKPEKPIDSFASCSR
jgi:hypothetical protein